MTSGPDRPVLVTGATGTHGGAIAESLLAARRPVRGFTRDAGSARARELAALGAELATGDLLDHESLVEAMSGVSAAYAVTTPFGDGTEAELAQGLQIIAAAEAAGLPWLVLASVASADRATGIPHFESKWRVEQALQSSPLVHTVVAPTYFYENLGDPRELIAAGELALPLPASRPLQQIALADLGAAVVALLARQPEFVGQRIELAAEQPTPEQMADALSAAGGTAVRYRRTELETVASRSADIAAMYGFLGDIGYQVDLASVRSRFPELKWTAFADWVRAGVAPRVS